MPQLLFINKTQSSEVLTRSFEPDEKSRILSHVQNRRRKDEAKRKRNARISATPGNIESRLDTQPNPDRPSEEDQKYQTITRLAVLSTYRPSHNSSDPFYSTAAGRDVGSHALLHLTFSQAAKMNFLSEAFAPPSVFLSSIPMRHDRVMQARLHRCIQDPLLMYATLAYGSSCLAWMFGVYDPARPPEYFLVKAISLARRRIASLPTPDPTRAPAPSQNPSPNPHLQHGQDAGEEEAEEIQWLALAIYSLATTENWNHMPPLWSRCPPQQALASRGDNFSAGAAETHLRALVRLVSSNGGWGAFDPYVLESAVLAAKYKSLWAMERPVVGLEWAPGAVPPVSLPASGDAKAGKSLLSLPLTGELKTIIADIAEYTRMARAAWSTSTPGPSRAVVHPSFALQNWLFLRLQSFQCRLMLLDEGLLSPLDECVRIVVLCFLLTSTHCHGAALMAARMASRIKPALAKARFWDRDGGSFWSSGLRFWCLCVGGIAAGKTIEREWFLERISELAGDCNERGEMGVRDGEVGECVYGYLFLWDSHGPELSALLKQLPSDVALYCYRAFAEPLPRSS